MSMTLDRQWRLKELVECTWADLPNFGPDVVYSPRVRTAWSHVGRGCLKSTIEVFQVVHQCAVKGAQDG